MLKIRDRLREHSFALVNTPGGDRTHDLRIWNPLLYQLSYRRNALQNALNEHFARFAHDSIEPARLARCIAYLRLILWSVCLRSFGQYLL